MPARTDPSAARSHISSFTSQTPPPGKTPTAGFGLFLKVSLTQSSPSVFHSRGGMSRLDARRSSAYPLSSGPFSRTVREAAACLGVREDQLLTRDTSHVSHPLFRKPRTECTLLLLHVNAAQLRSWLLPQSAHSRGGGTGCTHTLTQTALSTAHTSQLLLFCRGCIHGS